MKVASAMMNILRDQRSSSLTSRHARLVALTALTVVAVGILMGLGAVDLYETADRWVLRA
jgi:hypothetical protein